MMLLPRPLLWIGVLLGMGACAVAPSAPGGPAPAAAPAPMASLAGTRWVGVAEAITESRGLPRLEFVAGGRITGYTGCNMFSGTWSEQAGEVRFGAIAATKRMCLGPGADVEKRVLAALGSDSRVMRDATKLVIISPGGERFEFVPA